MAGATNLVVLLTDGADDNNVSGGLTLDALLNNLHDHLRHHAKAGQGDHGRPRHQHQLRDPAPISAATKAPTFSSPTSFDVSQVVLSALFD